MDSFLFFFRFLFGAIYVYWHWLSVCASPCWTQAHSRLFNIFENRRWIETWMFHCNGYMFIHYYDYCYYYCRFDWWKKVFAEGRRKNRQLNGNVCVQYNVIHFIQSTDFPFNVNFNANWREIGAVHLRWEYYVTTPGIASSSEMH